MSDETKALAIEPAPVLAVAVSATERLLQMAVQGNANMETIERFLAAKNAEEARESKKLYFEAFAKMQAELKPVDKEKEAKKDGRTMYAYAPIEDLIRENGPIIAKHGFSYTWRESDAEGGRQFTIIITGHGHSEETSVKIPNVPGTSMMNAAQAAMSMSTYGRRYTLMLGFGITTKDEDDDAQSLSFEFGLAQADTIRAMREASSIDELKVLFFASIKEKDDETKRQLTVIKDECVAKLRGQK